jgi:hypothetical protein
MADGPFTEGESGALFIKQEFFPSNEPVVLGASSSATR